jgi:hypothetical protein
MAKTGGKNQYSEQLDSFKDLFKRTSSAYRSQSMRDLAFYQGLQTKYTNFLAGVRDKAGKEEIQRLKSQYELEAGNVNKILKRREAAIDDAADYLSKSFSEKAESFGDNLGSILADVTAGNLEGWASGIKKIGESATKFSMAQEAKEAAGEGSKLAGSFGKVLGKLAPSILAIAAIAAGMAAVVKVLIDADAISKQWNKTLLEGGAAVGDISRNSSDLLDNLEEIRNAAKDFTNNAAWGTLADDQIKLLGAFSEGGFTIREMTKDLENAEERMRAYNQATSAALIFSNLLGESAESMVQHMTGQMEDLGIGLGGIQRRYQTIYKAAMDSGYGTKRFFSMVLQATSGMSMYNVRIEEAAGLMLKLSKILGTKTGQEFFQSLTKGYMDESYTDRFKRIILTGEKTTSRFMQEAAENNVKDFVSKISETMGGDALGKMLSTAFSAAGISFNLDKGVLENLTAGGDSGREAQEELSRKLLEVMKGMGPAQQRKVLAGLRLNELPPDQARAFENLLDVTAALKGGLGNLAKGLGGLDPGAKLGMILNQSFGLFEKTVDQLSGKSLAAFENAFGISGEQLETLRRVSRAVYGQWDSLKDAQKNAPKMAKEDRDALNKQLASEMGAMVDAQGRIFSATVDENGVLITNLNNEIKDVNDYIMSQGESMALAMEKPLTEVESDAKMVARNTTEMTKYLQMGVEHFLGGIYNVVSSILDFITGTKLSDSQKEAKRAALQGQNDLISSLISGQGNLMADRQKYQRAYDTGNGDQKKAAKLELDKIDAEMQANQMAVSVAKERIKIIQMISKGEGFQTIADFLKEADREIKGYTITTSGSGVALGEGGKEFPISSTTNIPGREKSLFMQTPGAQAQIAQWAKELQGQALTTVDAAIADATHKLSTGALSPAEYDSTMKSLLGERSALVENGVDQAELDAKILEEAKKQLDASFDLVKATDAQTATIEDLPEKMADETEEREAAKILAAAGFDPNSPQYAQHMTTMLGGLIPAEVMQKLGGLNKGQLGGLSSGKWSTQLAGLPGAQDFLLQMGAGGIKALMKVNNQDVISGMKPNGAFAMMGDAARGTSSGARVVNHTTVIHAYNDGPGVLRTIEKAQAAGNLD